MSDRQGCGPGCARGYHYDDTARTEEGAALLNLIERHCRLHLHVTVGLHNDGPIVDQARSYVAALEDRSIRHVPRSKAEFDRFALWVACECGWNENRDSEYGWSEHLARAALAAESEAK
jgi:hypothetical protein